MKARSLPSEITSTSPSALLEELGGASGSVASRWGSLPDLLAFPDLPEAAGVALEPWPAALEPCPAAVEVLVAPVVEAAPEPLCPPGAVEPVAELGEEPPPRLTISTTPTIAIAAIAPSTIAPPRREPEGRAWAPAPSSAAEPARISGSPARISAEPAGISGSPAGISDEPAGIAGKLSAPSGASSAASARAHARAGAEPWRYARASSRRAASV